MRCQAPFQPTSNSNQLQVLPQDDPQRDTIVNDKWGCSSLKQGGVKKCTSDPLAWPSSAWPPALPFTPSCGFVASNSTCAYFGDYSRWDSDDGPPLDWRWHATGLPSHQLCLKYSFHNQLCITEEYATYFNFTWQVVNKNHPALLNLFIHIRLKNPYSPDVSSHGKV